MEEVLRRGNMIAAHARVVKNRGAPGVDGMNIEELWGHCQKHWARIRNAGARHMNVAVPSEALRDMGLVSLLDEHRRLARSA
jgi:hypothetical protein